jgi:inner membrane protein YidH
VPRSRKPRWDQQGEEPDYRYSLANERTFLAWIRTGLALMAAAVGLRQLVPDFALPWVQGGASALLAALGLLAAGTAHRRWAGYQAAMRRGDPLPRSPMIPVLAAVLSLCAAAVLVAVVVQAV